MQADYLELGKAVGLARNPKDHDIGEINTSMKRFGFLERIIINKTTGRLLAGHGRIETLRKAKVKGETAPINVKIQNGSWLVPCDYVELPESEEEAAAIALNRLTEIGGWDDSMLTSVLSDLAAMDEDMLDGIGFDMDDVDQLIREQAPNDSTDEQPSDRQPDTDEIDQLLIKWGVKDGDVWQVGSGKAAHIVACGDCRDTAFVDRVFNVLDDPLVMLAMTSPPYAEQRKNQYSSVPESAYVDWWANVQLNVWQRLHDKGSFFVNIKPHSKDGQRSLYVMDLVIAMVRDWGWMFVDEFSWQRISAPGSWPNRFKNGFEPVYHFAKSAKLKFRPKAVASDSSGAAMGGSNRSMGNYYNTAEKMIEWDKALPSNVLPTFGNATGWQQAAAYPVGLPDFFVKAYSDKGDLVYDPFAGSGTTAVAAHINDRPSVSIELLPKYTAIILERLEQATQQQPTKLEVYSEQD